MTRARLNPLTIAANRSYFPAANRRRISWKFCPPGNAQNRSIGARASSRPLMVPAGGSVGRHWDPARTSWVLASSRLDQLSFLNCHRLL